MLEWVCLSPDDRDLIIEALGYESIELGDNLRYNSDYSELERERIKLAIDHCHSLAEALNLGEGVVSRE